MKDASKPEIWMITFPMPGAFAQTARMIEASGFDGIGVVDTQNLAADPYSQLCLAAHATKHLKLRTWVTNPVTRHPAVTASAIATVQAESGGRAVLGSAGEIGSRQDWRARAVEQRFRALHLAGAGLPSGRGGHPG